jgi:hypothetical protein
MSAIQVCASRGFQWGKSTQSYGVASKRWSSTADGYTLKTFKDLLAKAKAKPAAITFASSGVGTTSHIGAALIESMANVDMLHVPYKGAAPALQDVKVVKERSIKAD